eukprot:2505869-Rhodomonas_salina.1
MIRRSAGDRGLGSAELPVYYGTTTSSSTVTTTSGISYKKYHDRRLGTECPGREPGRRTAATECRTTGHITRSTTRTTTTSTTTSLSTALTSPRYMQLRYPGIRVSCEIIAVPGS